MKKIVPDPPSALTLRRNLEHDLAHQHTLDVLNRDAPNPSLLDGLKHTTARPAGRDSHFTTRPGISAEETLVQASMLLGGAAEISDEIQCNGSERGLIWSMIHNVEMAKALIDALLDGGRRPRLPPV